MVSLSNAIKEVSRFEPLLIDLLGEEINEQHARVLAMMFKLGGYTTLNKLTKYMPFAQPTVSIRVAELVEKGFLRKNSELMPMVIVLLLTVDELELQLRNRFDKQRNAIEFLRRMSEFRDKKLVKDTFIRAVNVLYEKETVLANMITNTYLNEIVVRNELYQQLENDLTEFTTMKSEFESILASKNDVFHVIYQKQKKEETFIRPRLPLKMFANYRLSYLESLFSHYEELLGELANYMSNEYESIDPHQVLKYPSDIKQRINICLKYYSTAKIIDNSVYRGEEDNDGILRLITGSENFRSDHEVKILSSRINQALKSAHSQRIEYRSLTGQISKDFMTRDFIIFENHGCLVFPAKPKGVPYYIISPSFITAILNVFESNWR
ncbi:MAG: hypothetical protein ACFFD4_31340 [Candidatus Odinarchaeota archaeon]